MSNYNYQQEPYPQEEAPKESTVTACLTCPYMNRSFPLKVITYHFNEKSRELYDRTLEYVLSNLGQLFTTAMYTFGCWCKFEFPEYYEEAAAYEQGEEYDEESGPRLRSLQDFFDLIRWEDGGIQLQIECAKEKDGIARYSFLVDMDYNFCDDGFQFFMEHGQMIGFEDGNDRTRIENDEEEFIVQREQLLQAVENWKNNARNQSPFCVTIIKDSKNI